MTARNRPIFKLIFVWVNTNIRSKYFDVTAKMCLNCESTAQYFLILEIPLIERALRSIKFENILEVIMKHNSLYGNEDGEGKAGRKKRIHNFVRNDNKISH